MDSTSQLRVILFSFGFKYGIPVDINQLFDVRFLPNPYWIPELRPKNGKEPDVADYVLTSEAGLAFWQHLQPLLLFLVKCHAASDKKTLRIAIGCTGGRHRSVAVTEKIAALLHTQPLQLTVFHRDITRDQ
jgi:RNase adapter protein RapZ